MNYSRNILLFLLVVAFSQNLQSQNWSTYGGNSARSGNSAITGPASVTTPFWAITNAVYIGLGENVYTFGDLFVNSRCSANFAKVIIECRSLQTGALVWTSPNLGQTSKLYCIGFSEDAVYACDYSNDSVYALNVANGSVKWTGALKSYSYGARESVVYACNGDIILNGPLTGEGTTMRLNKNNGEVFWTNQNLYAVSPVVPLAATETTVYRIIGAISQPIRLAAIDVETGTTLYYSPSLPGDGDQENPLTVGNDGRIYFWRDNGFLYSFKDNGAGFAENWTYSSVSPPVGGNNSRIAVGIDQSIYTFDAGKVIRLHHDNGSLLNTSVISIPGGNITVGADSTVYVSNESGTVYALSFNLQVILWQYSVNLNVFGNPVLAKDGIMVLTGKGSTITAFKPQLSRKPVADFRSSGRKVIAGEPVNFFDQSSYLPVSWEWTFNGANTTTSYEQNPAGIIYNTPGTYEVNLVTGNSSGTDTVTQNCYLEVVDTNIGVEIKIPAESDITVYPNPSTDLVWIRVSNNLMHNHYYLIDQVGRLIQTGVINTEITYLDISKLNKGIYLIQIGDQKYQNSRVVKD